MTLIREANADDADSIADLHISSWRNTYPGILPAHYLSQAIVEERQGYWRRMLSDPEPGSFVLLIPGQTQLLGFISVWRQCEPGYDALIDNLHVQPGQTGQGLGRGLLERAVDRLISVDACSVCLWVFDSNLPTVRFYERLGGIADQHGIDDFAGADAPHTRFGWHDLVALHKACCRDTRPPALPED